MLKSYFLGNWQKLFPENQAILFTLKSVKKFIGKMLEFFLMHFKILFSKIKARMFLGTALKFIFSRTTLGLIRNHAKIFIF